MKKIIHFVSRRAVKSMTMILPAIAMFFAVSPCYGKIYAPKIPDSLRKRIK